MNEYELATDASRSALAALRMLRNGDPEAAMALTATLDEGEQGAFAGACLALANATLQVCDQLSTELARATGKQAARAEDILRLALLGQYATGQIHD